MRRGLEAIGIAILLIAVGAIGLSLGQALSRFTAVAERRMPGAVTFEAEPGATYGVGLDDRGLDRVFGPTPGEQRRPDCTLVQGEREDALDRTVVADSGGLVRIATFEATSASVTVDCRWTGPTPDDSVQLLVFRIHPWVQRTLGALIGAGMIALLLGIWLLYRAGVLRDEDALGEPDERPHPPPPMTTGPDEPAPSPMPPDGASPMDVLRWGFDQARAGWAESQQPSTADPGDREDAVNERVRSDEQP
ncbi:hypothetical protein [Euzebya rosea]|uniref:hypothetical protein n=1 Tax=Euzebya rosea TaxID=2052804 RepID=UPI000D3E35BB|nr:hypothetical protein [Euzebya rosea]